MRASFARLTKTRGNTKGRQPVIVHAAHLRSTLDLSQGRRVLEHIGMHILYDLDVVQSISLPLCGLCLQPSPLCQFFLARGKGTHGKPRINQKMSRGCLIKMTDSYSAAAELSTLSPCSNMPIIKHYSLNMSNFGRSRISSELKWRKSGENGEK